MFVQPLDQNIDCLMQIKTIDVLITGLCIFLQQNAEFVIFGFKVLKYLQRKLIEFQKSVHICIFPIVSTLAPRAHCALCFVIRLFD